MSRSYAVRSRSIRHVLLVGLTCSVCPSAWIAPRDLLAQEPTKAAAQSKAGSEPGKSATSKSKFADFAQTIKGARRYDGLFTLYHKNEHLYAEIKPQQYNQMLLAPMAIARGMASAGTPLNFGDEWILVFRRVDDKIQLLRKNVHY